MLTLVLGPMSGCGDSMAHPKGSSVDFIICLQSRRWQRSAVPASLSQPAASHPRGPRARPLSQRDVGRRACLGPRDPTDPRKGPTGLPRSPTDPWEARSAPRSPGSRQTCSCTWPRLPPGFLLTLRGLAPPACPRCALYPQMHNCCSLLTGKHLAMAILGLLGTLQGTVRQHASGIMLFATSGCDCGLVVPICIWFPD